MNMPQVLVHMVVLLHSVRIVDLLGLLLALLDDVVFWMLALPSLLGSSGFVASALVVACPLDPVLCPVRIGHCTRLNLVLNYLKSVTQCPKNVLK